MKESKIMLFVFITVMLGMAGNTLAVDVIDNFNSYTSTSSLTTVWKWTGVASGRGDNMSIVLNTTDGYSSSKALQATFNFSNQTNPKGYTGRSLNNNSAVDWRPYDGISVWIKAVSETGNTPQYVQLAYHEGDGGSNGLWGDKFESAKVYLNSLDPAGEYVFLRFSDFTRYDGFGGDLDNGIQDLYDVRSIFVFLKYDGTATQTSSATVLVDDIRMVSSLSFVRPPYLQNVTQTSVKVMWGDNNATNSPVFWGSSAGNYTNSAASSVITAQDGSKIHTATISGLTVGEKVYYTVESSNWNDATYYATAAPASDASFRFTFYSDSHTDSDINQTAIINTMISHNPSIVLNGGDKVAEGAISEFNNFYFSNAAPLLKNTPTFSTIGNHDMPYTNPTNTVDKDYNYDTDVKNYHDLFDQPVNNSLEDGTEDYYSFDYGNVHFTCINSQRTQSGGTQGSAYYNPTYNDSMRAWLARDLQGSNKPWKVVFFHKPFYMSWQEQQEWASIFEANGVALVLQGHRHNYIAHEYNGVAYVMSGGGGGGLGEVIWGEWAGYSIGAFQDYNFVQVDVTSSMLQVKVFDRNDVVRHWINIDNTGKVTYPPVELLDNFQEYADDAGLQGAWNIVGTSQATSVNRYLDTGGITGNDNVMRVQFDFASGNTDGYGWVGTPGFRNWSADKAVKLWVKANTVGYSNQYLEFRIHEGSGGEKWKSPQINLNSLDPNGEYVYLNFNDFVRYDPGTNADLQDNKINKATLVRFYLIPGFNGTATSNGSSTIWVNNINGILNDTTTEKTHLDDNFESYANNSALASKWNLVYKSAGVTSFNVNLDGTGGVNGSKAMRMDIDIPSNTQPATGLGDNWDPCIYGITGYETPASGRTNLSNYSGLRLWLKPGPVSGDAGIYFKLNLIEDETKSDPEKWMSPKIYLSNLDPAGEFVYFDFNDFTEYYTNSGAPMERSKIKISYLWLAYDNTTTQRTTATVYVDSIKYLVELPPDPNDKTHLDDDFESYATTADLQSQWGTVYGSAGVTSFTRTLNTTAGEGGSKAMEMYIDISSGASPTTGLGVNWDPCIFGITGYYTPPANQTDMSNYYTGVRLWLKPGAVTGHPDVYFKLNLIEDEPSGTEEKWMSPKIYLKDLDPNGEYVYLDFNDFYQYYTSSTEAMELDKIKISYLFLAYDNNTTLRTTAKVYVDDIRYVRRAYRIPETDAMSFTLPDKYALRQNFPNPFNPVTTIQYDLPSAGDVQLVIYDILGREITTLVNGRMEAGFHQIRWDGRDRMGEKVASGVYIYLLKAGDYIGSKKLVLMK